MNNTKLIVGITGHYGAGRSTAAEFLQEAYGFENISLSSFLREGEEEHVAVDELQRRGDELRAHKGNNVLAGMALQRMGELSSDKYVIDGIKHPAEAKLLSTEGDFYLLAIQASAETRWDRSQDKLNRDRTRFDQINARDNIETDQWGVLVEHGQRVADCLLVADAFIWNDAPVQSILPEAPQGTLAELEEKIARFYAVVSSPGSEPPTPTEIRMCQAYTVARRSSCLQRKVGAVITNEADRILAEGYNEVPDGLPSCVEQYGMCYRIKVREKELQDLANVFRCQKCGGDLSASLKCSSCGNLHAHLVPSRPNLEYCRALHAEENAILQVSRYGGIGVEDGILYTTTFPCALCAKKIINTGIATVIFTEPYAAPEALDLFRAANTELLCFEGVTQRAFHRVYKEEGDSNV